MITSYQTIGIDSIARTGSIDWPKEPSFEQMKALIEPLIQTPGYSTAYIKHVRVWHENQYVSMFVDDMGALKKLPVNEAATLIYHANMVMQAREEGEEADTSDWPKIHGPAVLFNRNVWF